MRIQYKLEDKDISALIKHLFAFSKRARKAKFVIYYIAMPILMLIVNSWSAYQLNEPLYFQIIYVIYQTFFWTVLFTPVVYPLLFNLIVKIRIYNIQGGLEKRTYLLLDNGILIKNLKQEIIYKWKEFKQVVESETYYFVYLNEIELVVIPKKVIDPEINHNVKQLLQEKIQPYIQIKPKSDLIEFLIVLRIIMLFMCLLLSVFTKEDSSYNFLGSPQKEFFNNESNQSSEEGKETKKIDFTKVSLSVQNLLKMYPEQKAPFSELSLKYQEKIMVPMMSEIPFEIKEVEVYNDVLNGETDTAYIYIKGYEERLSILVYEYDSIETSGTEVIKLNQNIIGYFSDLDEEIYVSWRDPERGSKFVYTVDLYTTEYESIKKKKNKFSKEDLIKIAKSMIENY